jgi:hypothetical protein
MTMSDPLPAPDWQQTELFPMSSVADSPASRTALPAPAAPAMTSATCGPSSLASFARLGPDGSWLRTCQGFVQANLDGSLEAFCETWPAQGIVSNGEAFPLPTWAPRTGASASGSWPTPRAEGHDAGGTDPTRSLYVAVREARMWPTPIANDALGSMYCYGPKRDNGSRPIFLKLPGAVQMWPTPHGNCHTGAGTSGRDGGMNLQTAAAQWPTPASRDYRSPSLKVGTPDYFRAPTAGLPLIDAVGGALNPDWVEALMGLPVGWTDLGDRPGKKGCPE